MFSQGQPVICPQSSLRISVEKIGAILSCLLLYVIWPLSLTAFYIPFCFVFSIFIMWQQNFFSRPIYLVLFRLPVCVCQSLSLGKQCFMVFVKDVFWPFDLEIFILFYSYYSQVLFFSFCAKLSVCLGQKHLHLALSFSNLSIFFYVVLCA